MHPSAPGAAGPQRRPRRAGPITRPPIDLSPKSHRKGAKPARRLRWPNTSPSAAAPTQDDIPSHGAFRAFLWISNRVNVHVIRPSLLAISIGLSPSSTDHFFASVISAVAIFVHEDICDEARGEAGRGEHTHAHGQCLESQVQRMAARAPRLLSAYPMGCACKMLIREQVAQRLMEKSCTTRRRLPSIQKWCGA